MSLPLRLCFFFFFFVVVICLFVFVVSVSSEDMVGTAIPTEIFYFLVSCRGEFNVHHEFP